MLYHFSPLLRRFPPPAVPFPSLAVLFSSSRCIVFLSLPATTHMLTYADNQLRRRQDVFEAATHSRH